MRTTNLGMPNVHGGLLKRSVEDFWRSGVKDEGAILVAEARVRVLNEELQGVLDSIPVFDVDVYDRLLRTAVMFGWVPGRFGSAQEANDDLGVYLSIPRGTVSAVASPMVKWFDNNYHVVQPEIERLPCLVDRPRVPLVSEGRNFALIGPWTLLSYGINKTSYSVDDLLRCLQEEYAVFVNRLPKGCVVQLEEPCFLTKGVPKGYDSFVGLLERPIHLHTYFGGAEEIADALLCLPVEGLGLDFVGGRNLEFLSRFPSGMTLVAGVISGRNVRSATIETQQVLEKILSCVDESKVVISPSCSLAHVPVDIARQKILELVAIKEGNMKYETIVSASVGERQGGVDVRRDGLVSSFQYTTTTIGSFPQTSELRRTRAAWKSKNIGLLEYEQYIKNLIEGCVRKQESLGLDVLVHGEFERADMVEFFAEQLEGFVLQDGVVQSYGTRHLRPPVIVGDIKRRKPMTVDWFVYAQSLTDKPVKAILTGPVTMVQWSYPREDLAKEEQMYQMAGVLAEEVRDLVRVGAKHIQIDEPALREGLPVDKKKAERYLKHAVQAFRQVYASVPDDVMIHTHVCFSDFSNIMEIICALGVDVVSVEDSKAGGKTAAALRSGGFVGSIGLGVFDVHSPRIPSVQEMLVIPESLSLSPYRIWINPDCGLKTRGDEAYVQLKQMMHAAYILRGRQVVSALEGD